MTLEQGSDRHGPSKEIRPFTLRQLERDKEYLKRLLLGRWYREPLKEIAREFGRNPRRAQYIAARVQRTIDVGPPLAVLVTLGVDLAPMSREAQEKSVQELGF